MKLSFRGVIVAALAALTVLVAPTVASASYTISKSQAQAYARDAAVIRYGDKFGIHSTRAKCAPQFVRYDPAYTYHRWKCVWTGVDFEGDVAGGALRITGHSGNSYGHLVLIGIRWA